MAAPYHKKTSRHAIRSKQTRVNIFDQYFKALNEKNLNDLESQTEITP